MSARQTGGRARDERIEALIQLLGSPAAVAAMAAAFHAPVAAVSVANVAALTGLAVVVDGVALNTAGMRVLLANQTTPAQNGIWVVQAGAWTRPADWQTGSTRVAGEKVPVANGGTTNFLRFGSEWMVTTGGVVDTASIILFPKFDKGTGTLAGGVLVLADRWILTGAQGTANILTDADATAINVRALTQGAGTGQANGTASFRGIAAAATDFRFVIVNF